MSRPELPERAGGVAESDHGTFVGTRRSTQGLAITREEHREHRRRRFRRRGRRAYIRSVYFLPSLATLLNAVCGFGSIYVASLGTSASAGDDPLTQFFARHHFVVAVYLIFLAMLWDAIDGRLARFTRHTTDFGGQLDSLADVISFGAAPAFIALQVFKAYSLASLPPEVTRLVWCIGAFYLACAAMRLARFNASNEHGEQHHFSFLGLPSPAAGGCVAGLVLMQQVMIAYPTSDWRNTTGQALTYALPPITLLCGLLMVSSIRYPHIVNRYLRGQRSLSRLVVTIALILALVIAHQYVIGIGIIVYVLMGLTAWLPGRLRHRQLTPR